MLGFDAEQLVEKNVVLRIGNFWVVKYVVAMVVILDLFTESGYTFFFVLTDQCVGLIAVALCVHRKLFSSEFRYSLSIVS